MNMQAVAIPHQDDPEVSYTRPNRHVYEFLKWPEEDKLEPQARVILNTIQKYSPLTRFELCKYLIGVLQTRTTISAAVSYHTRHLIMYGTIKKHTPEGWRLELARRVDREQNALIKQNNRGGWSIHVPPDSAEGIGNFDSEESAREVVRRSAREEEEQKKTEHLRIRTELKNPGIQATEVMKTVEIKAKPDLIGIMTPPAPRVPKF